MVTITEPRVLCPIWTTGSKLTQEILTGEKWGAETWSTNDRTRAGANVRHIIRVEFLFFSIFRVVSKPLEPYRIKISDIEFVSLSGYFSEVESAFSKKYRNSETTTTNNLNFSEYMLCLTGGQTMPPHKQVNCRGKEKMCRWLWSKQNSQEVLKVVFGSVLTHWFGEW